MPADRVWEVVADPHHLPRWWPRAVRVEDVREEEGEAVHWTTVLGPRRAAASAPTTAAPAASRQSLAWEQEVEGTPFERILSRRDVRIEVEPEGEALASRWASPKSCAASPGWEPR